MREWLPAVAIVPLLAASTVAQAQTKRLTPIEVASVARNHNIDLRLSQQQGFDRPLPLMRGMIVQQGVADNAFVGIGLANIYGRKKGGDMRVSDRPPHSRKPAVSFVMKF
jgi:hypothetical protein